MWASGEQTQMHVSPGGGVQPGRLVRDRGALWTAPRPLTHR